MREIETKRKALGKGLEQLFSGESLYQNPLDKIESMISFKLKSLKEDSIFYKASYVTKIQKKETQKIKLGVGICTFNRQEYVKNNVKILKEIDFGTNNKLEVFISDNSQNLEINRKNKHIHIFKNKNTGGSGGFTRCMIEALNFSAKSKDKLTHFILMDDDVKFDSESIIRTFNLLTVIKDEYKLNFIGGAMLDMEEQELQFCNGEFWDCEFCEDFVVHNNNNRQLSNVLEILKNEAITKC